MRKIYSRLSVPLFFIFLTLLLFWQFFIKGAAPFPGSYMLAHFEPWKSDNLSNGRITIPHKPVAHDVFRQLYPFKLLGMEEIKNFKLPLWNPYNGAGQPLFATMHMGYLNPFNLIFFLLSPQYSWSIQVIIQPLLIGFTLYSYCRTLKISNFGSILSGISFMLSGFIITRSIYDDYNFAIIWMILALIIIEKYFSGAKRVIYTLPFLIFLIISSSQPQIIIYCTLFLFLYFIFKLWISDFKNSKTRLLNFIILFFLGIGLGAVQILPTLELYKLSNLTLESSRFIIDRFLLPPIHLFSLFIPNYFGNVATYNYWGSGDYIESIASIGLIPSFFAYLALKKSKLNIKDIRFFFFITIIVTIILSLKSPLTSFIYSLPIPAISSGIPSRIFLLTTLSISILAGFGFSEIHTESNRKKLIHALSFLLIPFLIISVSFFLLITKSDCNNSVIINCRSIALRNTLLEVVIFLFGFAAYIVAVKINNNNFKKGAIILIIFLVSISGLYNAQKFLPFSPISSFKPENELIDQILKISKYARIAGLGKANIKTDFATLYRYYDDNYYDPLYIKRYGELVAYANAQTILKRSDIEINSDVNLSDEKMRMRNRLFELTSTGYLIYKNSEIKNPHDVVWKNDKWIIIKNSALPHAYIVGDYKLAQNKNIILQEIFSSNFNPYQTVILEDKPNKKYIKQNYLTPAITKYDNDSIIIKTNEKENAILVLTDNYYPGWEVFVNGYNTKIFRANYTFRAIELPAGNNTIEFRYEPRSLFEGLLISFISFGGITGFFFKMGSFTG